MILVDTDVVIAHLRGHEQARTWLREARTAGPLSVSVVSIAELTGGMRSTERREVWQLLSVLRAEPVTEIIARRAGELHRGYRLSHPGIGTADYLVAATAEHRGAELATLNVRHFPMFPISRHHSPWPDVGSPPDWRLDRYPRPTHDSGGKGLYDRIIHATAIA